MTDFGAIFDILGTTRQAPHGPGRIAMAEEAVRLADTLQSIPLGMLTRMNLMDAATHGGQPELLLVAFSWCLSQLDKNPDVPHGHMLWWRFKWVGDCLPRFHQISRMQIDSTLDDMQRRYQERGLSLKPVYKLRCNAAMIMGRPSDAARWFAEWKHCQRDENNDCAACEADWESEYLLSSGDYPGAMRVAKQLVVTKALKCAEIPHKTYSRIALPTLRNGSVQDALDYQRIGYRLARENPDFIQQIGQQLEFAAEHGDVDQGLKMFERHAVWYTHSGSPLEHFTFLLGVRKVIAKAKQRSRQETRKLRFPRSLPFWQEDGNYRWDDLLAWADEALDKLANAFDQRNGNDHYTQQLAEARA